MNKYHFAVVYELIKCLPATRNEMYQCYVIINTKQEKGLKDTLVYEETLTFEQLSFTVLL